MIFDISDKTAIITCEGSDTTGPPFLVEIKRNYKYFSSLNIVIDISQMKSVLSTHIMEFIKLASSHKELNDKSFVIVTGSIALELLPDNLNVVPTWNEALDTIEIEEIERELGI